MDDLVESIEGLRFKNKNIEDRFFVPEGQLISVMSEPRVRMALRELGLHLYQHEELLSKIVEGARRCFAILLLIKCGRHILEFFRKDALQRSHPDDRLPFEPSSLAGLFDVKPDDLNVQRFLEKQWEFSTPFFSRLLLTRELGQGTILPIIHQEEIGEGSFGIAYRTTIHPQCHELPIEANKVGFAYENSRTIAEACRS